MGELVSETGSFPKVATNSIERAANSAPGQVGPSSGSLPALESGETSDLELPGYRVIRFFGKGGMGEVFLADRLSTTGVSVRCVVKTVKRGLANQEQFEGLFLDEARIISELRHPNITSVIDVGQADGRLYLAMEWIDGLDAGDLAEKSAALGGDIPLPHVLYILRETLQGLHYAHTALDVSGTPLNLVHRDISQGNILISRHGAVKLADFGVAVGSHARTAGSAENLAGKPHYFAPELWRGARASAGTDVFALGVTFYELLSSAPLFSRNKDLRALAFEICEFRVDELIESNLTIPDGLEDILRRCLHENPAERYPSALEFLEDVNDYAYEFGIRLLDAHFGEYVARILSDESNRSSLWKG
jgi:serine/threonine-protein kinase